MTRLEIAREAARLEREAENAPTVAMCLLMLRRSAILKILSKPQRTNNERGGN